MAQADKPVSAADVDVGVDDGVEPDGGAIDDVQQEGGRKFWLILLPLALLALCGGGWVAYSQYGSLSQAAAMLGVSGEGGEEDEEKPIEYGEFMEIPGIIVNPAGSGGRRYLMVNLGLESHEEAVLEEVKQKDIVVRDTVLKVLGRRTVEELAAIEMRNQLKHELLLAVNAVLRKGEITRLYFTQYVLQ